MTFGLCLLSATTGSSVIYLIKSMKTTRLNDSLSAFPLEKLKTHCTAVAASQILRCGYCAHSPPGTQPGTNISTHRGTPRHTANQTHRCTDTCLHSCVCTHTDTYNYGQIRILTQGIYLPKQYTHKYTHNRSIQYTHAHQLTSVNSHTFAHSYTNAHKSAVFTC